VTPAEKQSALLDALHTAYFEDGKDVGDAIVLEAVGKTAGLDDETLARAREAWADPAARREMLAVIQQVQQAGVSGVPFFIFDGVLAASGAQPPEVLAGAMQQAREMPATAQAD
jgi:predicted DsbA family dithiol-disulfide isomerase